MWTDFLLNAAFGIAFIYVFWKSLAWAVRYTFFRPRAPDLFLPGVVFLGDSYMIVHEDARQSLIFPHATKRGFKRSGHTDTYHVSPHDVARLIRQIAHNGRK